MNSMTDLVVPGMKSLTMCDVPRYKRCPFYLTQDLFCRLSMVCSFKAIAGGMHAGIYYRACSCRNFFYRGEALVYIKACTIPRVCILSALVIRMSGTFVENASTSA